jgi:hypothetical protein
VPPCKHGQFGHSSRSRIHQPLSTSELCTSHSISRIDLSSTPAQLWLACIVLYASIVSTVLIRGYRARLPFSKLYQHGMVRIWLFPLKSSSLSQEQECSFHNLAHALMESNLREFTCPSTYPQATALRCSTASCLCRAFKELPRRGLPLLPTSLAV